MFERFEPGKIGASGGFEFTGSHGAYDPGFVAGPEYQDGHPANAGPHHASHCAIFVAWTAAAVPGPNDGSRRDHVPCIEHNRSPSTGGQRVLRCHNTVYSIFIQPPIMRAVPQHFSRIQIHAPPWKSVVGDSVRRFRPRTGHTRGSGRSCQSWWSKRPNGLHRSIVGRTVRRQVSEPACLRLLPA